MVLPRKIHSNIAKDVAHREIYGCMPLKFYGVRSKALRSYKMIDLLPPDALYDILLGFTSDGQYLVSYLPICIPDIPLDSLEDLESMPPSEPERAWSLRFWEFCHPQIKLVTDIPFMVSPDLLFGVNAENVGIRFCETPSSNGFVLTILNWLTRRTHVYWGSMPEIDCTVCKHPSLDCPRHQTLLTICVENDDNLIQVEPAIVNKEDGMIVCFHTTDTVYVTNCTIIHHHNEEEGVIRRYSYPRSQHAISEGLKMIHSNTVLLDNYCAMCYSMFYTGEFSKLPSCRERRKTTSTDDVSNNDLCILCSKYFQKIDISQLPCHASLSQLDEASLEWSSKAHKFSYHKYSSDSLSLRRRLLEKVPSVISCRPVSWLTWFSDKTVSYSHHYFSVTKQLEGPQSDDDWEDYSNSPRESEVVDFSYEVHNPYHLTNTKGYRCSDNSLTENMQKALASFHVEELALQIEIAAFPPSNSEIRRRLWGVKSAKFLDPQTLLIEAVDRRLLTTSTVSPSTYNEGFFVLWDLVTGSWSRLPAEKEAGCLAQLLVGTGTHSEMAIRELNNKMLEEEGISVSSQTDALGILEVTL